MSYKALNQAVSRNPGRFPEDFSFRLTKKERDEVVTKCDHLKALKFSHSMPFAFTEQGVAMLSSVLKSERAARVNVAIMRAFVRLREILTIHKDLARRLEKLEGTVGSHDAQFDVVFDAVRKLMRESDKPRRQIGFTADNL